jgi:hypothetical protein
MFDALALDLGNSFHIGRIPPNVKADMAWLSQEGLLSTIGGITARPNSMRTPKVIDGGILPKSAMRNVNFAARSALLAAGGFGIRETASDLRSKYGIDAVAIPQERPTDLDEPLTRDTVIRITLTHFPVPSEITPWEAIKDFRQDEEARTQWLMLKQWINELARSDKKPFEVADYIEFLAADYRESLRLARMQTQSGTLGAGQRRAPSCEASLRADRSMRGDFNRAAHGTIYSAENIPMFHRVCLANAALTGYKLPFQQSFGTKP